MAHLVSRMAFVGAEPWHGLGHRLPPKQPIEIWAKSAGMDWRIEKTSVLFLAESAGAQKSIHTFDEQQVLYRSDTKTALSVVSARYQVVQPREVLEFYRDLTEVFGYELETAGVLKGGRKFWALANTGQATALKGNDVVKAYLLLATSCDGSLATLATPTTIRVVCSNTLAMAETGAKLAIRVPHSTRFDAQAVKEQLGIAIPQWASFIDRMRALSERKVNTREAKHYFMQVLCGVPAEDTKRTPRIHERALRRVQRLYDGQGRGAELASSKGTAWGLLSALTEYVDHERRARGPEYRLDSAWFGAGAALKKRALEAALQLAT